jgi:lysophospholipase L1-like esterase
MSTNAPPTFLARLAHRPFPIFLGVAVGFLSCCVAGRVAARQQPIKNFTRFHMGISPNTHYYPTFSQTLNMAREHAKPGKTLVIVSGNSIFNGVGQRPEHLWTLHLQHVLGDDFVVLNLAVRAGTQEEFGALIADRLTADGVPVILVCCGKPKGWDGGTYRYLFWDAWGKGLLPPDPRRDHWLTNEFATQNANDQNVLEKRRGGLVDGAVYFRDLWNYVAYKHRGTVWTPLKYPNFWEPHSRSVDNEPGATIPFEVCNNPSQEADIFTNMRKVTNTPQAEALMAGQYEPMGDYHMATIPDRLHDRTLQVIPLAGAYFRKRMPPDELARYHEIHCRYRDALLRAGIQAQLVGENFADTDYSDGLHIGEPGGKKMAEELAPTIRAMNERLWKVPPH